MKRLIITYISIAIIVLAGCEERTVNPVGEVKKEVILTDKAEVQELQISKDGITLEMEEDRYKPYEKTITLNILNETNTDLIGGAHFFLEKKENGIWYVFPYKSNTFTEEGLLVRGKATLSIEVSELKYDFSPGEYRARYNNLAVPFEVTLN